MPTAADPPKTRASTTIRTVRLLTYFTDQANAPHPRLSARRRSQATESRRPARHSQREDGSPRSAG